MFHKYNLILSGLAAVILVMIVVIIFNQFMYADNKNSQDGYGRVISYSKKNIQKVIVETNEHIYYIEPQVCKMYIHKLIQNLVVVYNTHKTQTLLYLDSTAIQQIRQDLTNYLQSGNLQSGNLQSGNFYTEEDRYFAAKKFRLDKYNVEAKPANGGLSCSTFNDNEIQPDEFIDILLDLERIQQRLDLEAITNLVNIKDLNRDKLNLRFLQNMLKNISQKIKHDTDELYISNHPEILTLDDIIPGDIMTQQAENDALNFLKKKNVLSPTRNTELSQNNAVQYNTFAEDSEQLCNEADMSPLAPKATTLINTPTGLFRDVETAHTFYNSETNMLSRNATRNNTGNEVSSFCNVDKARAEHLRKKAITTDLNACRSLRNDYAFLDE